MPNNNSNRTIPSPFDIIPEPVCILDGAGTILDVFDCSVPVFINNRQGRPGARIYDILLPEITAALRKSVDEALRSGRRVLLDNSVEAGTLRLTIHPLKSPSEIVDRMLLIAEEMIDNDRTKSLLEKERIFNKTIMESIPGTFYMLDENWHYVKWNAYQRDQIYGKTDSEMLDTLALESIHPEDRALIGEKLLGAYEHGYDVTIEARVLLRGGPNFRWFLLQGCWFMADGKRLGVGFGIDITERKHYEALSEFRNRLKETAETASVDELLTATLNEAKRMTDSSMGFFHFIANDETNLSMPARSTNTTKSRCKSAESGDHYPLDRTGIWADVIREQKAVVRNEYSSLKQLQCMSRELIVQVIRGKQIQAIVGIGNKPWNYNEEDIRRVTQLADMAWDIIAKTHADKEQEKIQKQLLQAQKMDMVGQLAGGIAHDFNNLLMSILSNTEIALDLVDFSDPVHTHLETIQRATNRSANLTRQLLAFARKQTVIPKIVELNAVIEEALAMLRPLISKDISIIWSPSPKPIRIKIDPGQIDQILVNLCINARDAITTNGLITIGTEFCKHKAYQSSVFDSDISGTDIAISVTDNGCGIEERDLPHIFEPFFTTKQIGKGTGLGLSTVYGIVTQNNGSIRCESTHGKGTTFTIHLSEHSENQRNSEYKERPPINTTGKATILLVDDEPNILSICRDILEHNGYSVLTVPSALDAIQIFENHKGAIHMLLTDVVMPGMNGTELSKTLTSQCPGLKTLFISGYTSDFIGHNAFFNEGVNFITKPFGIKMLMKSVQDILNNQVC